MQPNKPQTFDGHAINDGISYRATIMNAGVLPSAGNVFISQAQADSVDSQGYSVALRTPLVYIQILNYGTRHALAEQLKRWFRPGTRGTLVSKFIDDGLNYQLNCAVINIVQEQGNPLVYIAQLESGDTNWRAVTADTDSWTVTGTGGTKTISVLGGDETRLSATLTSTTGGVIGYDRQNIYSLPGVPGINYGTRPWCININSAALVAAGKLQADMDDYRILIDGLETKRWIVNKNTTSTNIWFNAPIGRGESLTLMTAIASTGAITVMQFQRSPANKAAIKRMPTKGIVKHGTEWISYSGKDILNCRLKLPGRGLYGTALQAHANGDAFLYVPHLIVTRYSNAAVTGPELLDLNYDRDKPLFDLSASDNTKWVYTAATKFYDPTRPTAPGSWTPVLVRLGDQSKAYAVKQDAETGDPALGGKLASWLRNGLPDTEVGRAGWQIACPGGFSQITMGGRKYANGSARWPAIAGCQRSDNGTEWYSVFNETIPTLSTWTTFTRTAVAVATTSKYLFVGLDGTIVKLLNALAMLETLTATIVFYSTNLPSAALLGETGNFSLDLTFANNTTGDELYLDYPMILNSQFIVDGENFDVTYHGHAMNGALRLDDEGRNVWLRLNPGNNVLQISSADAGTLSVALSWYRRRL